MRNEYKTFITFLDENIQSDNELDLIIYNIGTVQRIAEQFSQFYNQQIKDKKDYDLIDLEIEFETECNKKIHLALGLGDPSTLFIECDAINNDEQSFFNIRVNKKRIAALTLEGMHDI